MLNSVAVLYHPVRPVARDEAEWLAGQLRKRSIETLLGNGWDAETIRQVCRKRDLVVALGGDGTIIHVARLAAPLGTPVVGVNLGRVGFLAEMTPDSLHRQIDVLAEGRFWIEQRAMLDVHLQSHDGVEQYLALNEVAVSRGGLPHAVHVKTMLDGEDFITFVADGVLVATATGSTAYSLAAGGPIVYPESTDLLITPVAPHLHIGRSTVVPGATEVCLRLIGDRRGVVVVDGAEERELTPAQCVRVCRSTHSAQFARFGPRRYFYSAIADRLK